MDTALDISPYKNLKNYKCIWKQDAKSAHLARKWVSTGLYRLYLKANFVVSNPNHGCSGTFIFFDIFYE